MAKRKTKDWPLYKNPNGQWMKKIGGKARYFGTDLEEVPQRYALDKGRLAANLPPLWNDTGPNVSELGIVCLDAKSKAVESRNLERGERGTYIGTND